MYKKEHRVHHRFNEIFVITTFQATFICPTVNFSTVLTVNTDNYRIDSIQRHLFMPTRMTQKLEKLNQKDMTAKFVQFVIQLFFSKIASILEFGVFSVTQDLSDLGSKNQIKF
eukprot:TRINITY_DN5772_c0_g1_i3.p2 TRINITY_DN5772_c0_g1~~TRINITY_DN5772_c0_g1_i3.p2  ORF type:complete len:113 (-),score=4.69 TRINITY_DN5772_c0_g1_i3:196-534(-)